MATVVYTFVAHPFVQAKFNYLDIFNECTIMLMSYATIPYSDYLIDPHFKYKIGWIVIGAFFGNLLCNISFIVVLNFIKIYKMLKKKWNKKKLEKARKGSKGSEEVDFTQVNKTDQNLLTYSGVSQRKP
jgi:hypothetical protein